MTAQTEQSAHVTGLLLSDDMIFTSRIVGTARDLGLQVQSARSVDIIERLAKEMLPSCIIIDLNNPGLSIRDFLQRLKAITTPMPHIVAYGSHVDGPRLAAAKAAGCDEVMARSRFVAELPQALPKWIAARG